MDYQLFLCLILLHSGATNTDVTWLVLRKQSSEQKIDEAKEKLKHVS